MFANRPYMWFRDAGRRGVLSYGLCLWALCGVLGLPGVEAAFEGGCIVSHLIEPPRHTGAGSLVRSGAVGDDALAVYLATLLRFPLSGPFFHLVGGDPHGAGDAATVLFILGAGTDVENDGRVFAF